MAERVNSFFAGLRTAYLQQGQLGKVLIPVALVVLCCLCLVPIPLLRALNPSSPVPSPIVLPSEATGGTPTSLFAFSTFTPFPTSTSFLPTAFPSFTPSPTGTNTPTQTVPAATATSVPTTTPVPTDTVTATPTSTSPVVIVNVDKAAEFVEIQNFTQAPVNLRGWSLVSENGGESCTLRGTLEPGDVRRIWARRGDPGFDCRLGREIWIDDEVDPAVLYNAEDEEVSRYP